MQEFQFRINYDDASYTVTGYRGDEEHVVVPNTHGGKPVTIVYDNLFAGHTEITSVALPGTLTDLGEFVFDGCENLRRIELPKGLNCLWGHTFTRSGFEEVTLPDGVRSIPPYAFTECARLKKVVCGAGMKKIYAWAFGGCPGLEKVVCGPDVEISPDAYKINEQKKKV